jgi:hypothetical protein
MTKDFKTVLTVFIFIFLTLQSSFGQDTSKLFDNAWRTLKRQLLRKADAVSIFANFLQQNKNADSLLLRKLSSNKFYLIHLLNSPNPLDSNIITNIHDANDSLSILINEGYNVLLNDKRFIQSDGFIYVATELEGTENRIYIAVKDYNDSCKSIRRQDLYFKRLWGDGT